MSKLEELVATHLIKPGAPPVTVKLRPDSLVVPSTPPSIPPITKLPAPAVPAPAVPSGTVRLYRDNNWRSASLDLRTAEFAQMNVRNSIAGTPMNDAATWVAFNLPVGTVMTLMNNFTPVQPGQLVCDLSHCDTCIDLVGTGTTEGVDLTQVNMNDCVSAFFWRTVDQSLGAVELYSDSGFTGNRNVIFLGEWPSTTVIPIASWWLNDKVSSARWTTLNDRQVVSLFENSDGSGKSYQNIEGWGATHDIANLSAAGFNDCMSSFLWNGLVPKKEVIESFTLNLQLSAAGALTIQSQQQGQNISSATEQQTLTLKDTNSQQVTITATETQVVGVKVTAEVSYDISPAVSGKLSVELDYSYTDTHTTTTSTTNTMEIDIAQQVTIPPNCNWTATLTAQIASLPPTTYSTTAERWYDQPVRGGVQDPANNNWYKRTEQLSGTISGGLLSTFNSHVSATPI